MDKIGAHVIGGTSLALGKPRLVKLVDVSPEYVRDVRALVGPNCLIIVRWVTMNQNLDQPLTKARQWYATHAGQIARMYDANVAFESFNEIADTNAMSYALFEAERLRLMHSSGYRSVVGNWSVGVPKETMWPTYKPMLDAMGPGDLVGMHAYWSDRADIRNPWHTARWTLPEVKPYLIGKMIVVTECGRDVVEGKGKPGWQLTCKDADEFLGDLAEDNALMERFPNVVGGVVYQVGAIDDQWKPFAVDAIWPRVVASYSVPQTYPAVTTPVTPPPPAPTPMFPYVGKTFFPTGFEAYLKGVKPFAGLKWVVVHHTATDAAAWLRFSQEYWAKQLADYYYGKGWTAMPHLFISDRGILVENPLNLNGRGVAGHNQDSLHLETVGNFMTAPPSGPTLDNLIAACASLLKWAGLGIGGLTNHRSLQVAFTECPGDAFLNVWGAFQSKISDILTPPPPVHEGLPEDETATDAVTISQKCRWWAEEMQRQTQVGNLPYAERIRLGLIQLLYRLEDIITKP